MPRTPFIPFIPCNLYSVLQANRLEGGGKTPILSPAEPEEIGFSLVAYPLSLIEVTYPNFSVPTPKQDGPIRKNSSGTSATSARRTSNVKENRTQKPKAVVSKSQSVMVDISHFSCKHEF
jgi:hypothetical protein